MLEILQLIAGLAADVLWLDTNNFHKPIEQIKNKISIKDLKKGDIVQFENGRLATVKLLKIEICELNTVRIYFEESIRPAWSIVGTVYYESGKHFYDDEWDIIEILKNEEVTV